MDLGSGVLIAAIAAASRDFAPLLGIVILARDPHLGQQFDPKAVGASLIRRPDDSPSSFPAWASFMAPTVSASVRAPSNAAVARAIKLSSESAPLVPSILAVRSGITAGSVVSSALMADPPHASHLNAAVV